MNKEMLTVAIHLLTQQITGLSAQLIVANSASGEDESVSAFDRTQPVIVMGPNPLPVTGGPGGPGGPGSGRPSADKKPKEDDGGSKMGELLSRRFMAVLGPIAILGVVVSSATSGFQVMTKSVQLFAATLAPILLPVAILIATAFTAVSEVLMGMLSPSLELFFGLILSLGIPVLIAFISVLEEVSDAFHDLVKWVKRQLPSDDPHGIGGMETRINWSGEIELVGATPEQELEFNRRVEQEKQWLKANNVEVESQGMLYSRDFDREVAAARTVMAQMIEEAKIAPASAPAPSSAETIVMNALRDVTRSFGMAMGPRASSNSISEVGRQVQLAALNQDPIEARMLRVQQDIRQMLERVVSGIERERGVYSTRDGVWDHDTGSGGEF